MITAPAQCTVSVIMPTFNASNTLPQAIASLQAQTMTDWELLAVDDCSRDDSAAVVEAFAASDQRIRPIRLRENSGPGTARNHGLAAARGVWVALLDADDRYQPERLAKLLAEAARTGADMVSDNVRSFGDTASTGLMFGPDQLPRDALGPMAFLRGNRGRRGQGRTGLGFMKPMFRRDFLEQHGLRYEAASFSEDFILYLDCLLHGARWHVLADAFYDYNVRDDSLTAIYSPEQMLVVAAVLERLRLRARPALARPVVRALREHQRAVERAAAWTHFVQSVRDRRFDHACRTALRSPRTFMDITGEVVSALPRVAARSVGRAQG